jgi:cell wall-associated NlpC family hydrolase
VLAEAETRQGDPYVYGADGPEAFDCSGLIYWAAQQLGINMPRDTYEMLSTGVADGILIPTSHPQPGDLAFFGTGHVELVTSIPDTTFGAQQPGTVVGFNKYYPPSYEPTAYYSIS